MDPKEIRSLLLTELRSDGPESRTIRGTAAVYGVEADICGCFLEKIDKRAFTESLKTVDILALYSHNSERLIGRLSSGTLRLKNTPQGLTFEVDLPNTATGNEVLELVDRGDLKGMSIGFIVLEDEWNKDLSARTVKRAELLEISVVAWPAYVETSVAMRSRDKAKDARAAQVRSRLSLRLRAARLRIKKGH